MDRAKRSETGRVSGGYVLFARAIEQSALWRDPPEILKLFIYLLLRARYKAEPKQFDGFQEKRGLRWRISPRITSTTSAGACSGLDKKWAECWKNCRGKDELS